MLNTHTDSRSERRPAARSERSPSSSLLARKLRRLNSDAGQNLIEFALITPFVLAFLAAIVVFGLALFERSNLQQAMREGARQAAVGASLTDVQNLAAGNSNGDLQPSEVRWCHPVDDDGTQGKLGDDVRVYIVDSGDSQKGKPFNLVPVNGIFKAFNVSNLTIRLSPEATARLEKSVPSASVVNCT